MEGAGNIFQHTVAQLSSYPIKPIKLHVKGGQTTMQGATSVGERSNFKKFPTHTQDHGDA